MTCIPRIALLAVAGAAACAQPPGPALPLVPAEIAPGAAAGVTGEARFDVVATRDGVSVPATCTAEGTGFRAAFAAPATVAIPSFGPQSAAVRVACTADGRRGARAILPALRQTAGYGGVYPSIGVGIGSGGGAGVSIGGFWGGGTSAPEPYVVRYPDVAIELR